MINQKRRTLQLLCGMILALGIVLCGTRSVQAEEPDASVVMGEEVLDEATTSRLIHMPVYKTWVGDPGPEIEVELIADGVPMNRIIVLSEQSNWEGLFMAFPRFSDEDGHEITYTIRERDVLGYTASYGGSMEEGFTITNTPLPTTIVEVTKFWLGEPGESATFHLYANGEDTGEAITLTAENDVLGLGDLWWGGFGIELIKDEAGNVVDVQQTGVPVYDENGGKIEYTVVEEEGTGFTGKTIKSGMSLIKSGYDSENNAFLAVNQPTTSVSVEKKWEGDPTEAVTVRLLADGEVVQTATITERDDWQITFESLPKYDLSSLDEVNWKEADLFEEMQKDFPEIAYTVEEEKIDGYSSEITGDPENGFVITNTKEPEEPDKPNEPDKPSEPKRETPKKTTSVKTGDSSPVAMWFVLVLAASFCLTYFFRKRVR